MKKQLLEKFVFEKFKDYCFANAEEFRNAMAKYKINASNVWINITKYQVKKYGTTLIRHYGKLGRYENRGKKAIQGTETQHKKH